MNALCGLPRFACPLLALLCVAFVPAVARANDDARVRELIKEAQRSIVTLNEELNELQYISERNNPGGMGSMSTPGSSSRSMIQNRAAEREADRIGDIGDEIYRIASRCGKDGRAVGADFRTSTRRLRATVKRLSSSSTMASARLDYSKAHTDLETVANSTAHLVQIQGCVADEPAPDEAKEPEKSAEPEEDKQPE